jgi:CPA2 family monovalent cation:H+ antiporter-2
VHVGEFLIRALVILGGSVAVVYLSAKVRLPSVVGLILAGLVIGPSGLGWVHEAEQVEVFAEIGVVLLLFIIGLEITVGDLKDLGRPFFLGGGAQAILTLAAAAGLALLLTGGDWRPAIFAAMAVTLSSTAVVLKLYDERRETQTPQGKVVLGVLLFQDFLIVPMIVITPVLAGTAASSAGELAARFAGALVAVTAVVIAARRLMPYVLHELVRVRVREILVLAALATCLALSWFTWSLGFSLALGAFVAGILVSETEYSHQIVADIVPFRDVFASLFFVSIGMLVDLRFALLHLPQLVGLTAVVVIVKALLAGLAIRLVGYPPRIAVIGGLGLAQIGEFSFVLMGVGRQVGLLAESGFQILLATSVLTILVTPILIQIAPDLGHRIGKLVKEPPSTPGEDETSTLGGHVVVVGYGVNGSVLCRVLGEAKIPYVVLELNGVTVRQAQEKGIPIRYGDASRREILEMAGVDRAQVVVFAISDLKAVRRGVRMARTLNPAAEIIVRTRMVREIETLRDAGADDVISEEFEAAIEIFNLVLERFHVPRNVIRAQTLLLRGEGYLMLRSARMGREVSEAVLKAFEAGTTELYRVDEESAAAGSTLRRLELRKRTGASVIAIVRGADSHPNPSPDFEIQNGDCLVTVGGHVEIDRAFSLLDGRPLPPLPAPPLRKT